MSRLENVLKKYGKEPFSPKDVIAIDIKYMRDFEINEIIEYCSEHDKLVFIVSKEDLEKDRGVAFEITANGMAGKSMGIIGTINRVRAKDTFGIADNMYA